MIGVSAFMSLWMSNTAAAAILLPIAMAVTAPLASVGYRRAVVLGIAYAATVGGVGSARKTTSLRPRAWARSVVKSSRPSWRLRSK